VKPGVIFDPTPVLGLRVDFYALLWIGRSDSVLFLVLSSMVFCGLVLWAWAWSRTAQSGSLGLVLGVEFYGLLRTWSWSRTARS